ncbi:MAG: hypothetical protein N4A61_11085 [Pelagimonas sp.]|jgi:hypothetical protein|nr:hypothetical protein [Pelagimonas sp.]
MSKEILKAIAAWKVEAKFEDIPKYFFKGYEFERILEGDYSLVLGRKGSGKTAIAEYICRSDSKGQYQAQNLSFKNFPFNELYSLNDDRFTHPNQYITIWKYVILSFICRMIGENPRVDPLVSRQLNKAFGNNADNNLASIIRKWTVGKINLSAFGVGGGVEKEGKSETDWIRSVEQLESIVARYGKGQRYFIVLDELDEDFKDVIGRYKNDQYLQLLTSLIKAVSEIRSISVTNDLRVYPVIFLRDDIFDLLRDNDKNKLVDVTLNLQWDKQKICDMLAYRIARSSPDTADDLSFKSASELVFKHKWTKYGHRQQKRMSTFEFIARSTHMRPRDFIRYFQLSAEHELKSGNDKIEGGTLRHVDASFSPYLKNELVDEIESIIPEIEEVFDVLSHINKQSITPEEFRAAFEELSPTKQSEIDADTCLKLLFHFSVIGNAGKGNSPLIFFKYEYPRRKLNYGLPMVVHRGLYKALEIV